MLNQLINKIFGSRNDRMVRKMRRTVEQINALEADLQQLDDAALQAMTPRLRERHQQGETLDALLPEAFALVREASRRVLGMRHFDVQLIGGMVLHQGRIAEMRTGEGKTLVATLPVFLNALSGRGVHVVTVNDYLAQRDAEWMGGLYRFLGLSVGVVYPGIGFEAKHAAYRADITYATNNELGFDYLRDNMAFSPEMRVQRALNFAVVDEVDSILIDEARTPLIISGPAEDSSAMYQQINVLVPKLLPQPEEDGPGDYSVDEKHKQVHLTEEGHQHVEELLSEAGLLDDRSSLYDPANLALFHHLNASLRAHALYRRDDHYIVRDGQVVIVDEFTGRTLSGRRWSDGLHQAIEAKEGVKIQPENQTLASITFQNYFRLYEKLAGMTGTADTEAYEFQQIYGLEVVVIPTHRAMVRDDRGDQVFLTAEEKFDAVIADINDAYTRKQPVLVGTTSIEVSEHLSKLLKKKRIAHEVLNAKQHQREAQIIAQAGRPGSVTIATNMAGRGTDIVLGGNLQRELDELGEEAEVDAQERVRSEWQVRHDAVLAAGGLHIIGTERHESRRIDNQLRGRAGRQGDLGSSRFYLSLDDSLMRIFASDRVKGMMQRLGMQKGESIEHPWVTRAIANAQRKVEAHNFDIRKSLLEFDDVANDQRTVVYRQRNELMESETVSETIDSMRFEALQRQIDHFIPRQSLHEQWDIPSLQDALQRQYQLDLNLQQWLDDDADLHEEPLRERIVAALDTRHAEKRAEVGDQAMNYVEKRILLEVLDNHWKEHLAAMDYLRQGIHLRGYAQKNPKQEYKREAFEMFSAMLDRIQDETISMLARLQLKTEPVAAAAPPPPVALDDSQLQYRHEEAERPLEDEEALPAAVGSDHAHPEPFVRGGRKVGRNEPCPCGSGKKFKHCHGRIQN